MPTVYVHATRPQIRQMMRVAIGALAGNHADATGQVRQLMLAMGMEAMSIVKEAFLVKAAGGTDEAGLTWPPLSPKTIAYSRRHPGLTAKRNAATAEGRPGRPLLTKAENDRWKKIFAGRVHAYQKKGASLKEAKAHAAATAWMILKAEGGKTILGEYGDTKVEILRDTGLLLNSFSPGVPSKEQILRTEPGAVILGTNRKGAADHHRGIPGRLPQRRLWPEVSSWPAAWWDRIAGVLRQGTISLVTRMLGG